MIAYYNEIDPSAAAWLRELIVQGHIAPGEVDERSIVDVRPDDLAGFAQCHFFAGIGVWSYALRNAGWPDDRPVWTGSCPCPPFSSAGKGQVCPDCGSKRNLCHPRRTGYFVCLDCGCSRHADERHLWPEFSRLIRECRPTVVLGEQVASADGRLWLDVVSADLRLARYGVGGADLCAAGFGAPHIRQRLYWLAHAVLGSGQQPHGHATERRREEDAEQAWLGSGTGRLADADGDGLDPLPGYQCRATERDAEPCGDIRGLADADSGERHRIADGEGCLGDGPASGRVEGDGEPERGGATCRPGPTNGLWRDADWLLCRDGKWRPVEPGTFPLAHGAPARVGRLRGYGNAINAAQATAFVEAAIDALRTVRPAA